MKKVDLTEGSIIKVIIALALPIMGSSFLQLTYNLIDMLWVGHLGSNAVASIGSSGFFISLGYAVNAFVITGTGIKVSHAVGKKDERAVEEYMNAGLLINLAVSIGYGTILVVFGKLFIDFLHLNNKLVEMDAYYYLLINIPILFFSFFNMLYVRVLGSFGNTKEALIISSAGVILNILIDPLFIYTFKMGVLGAGAATLIANIVMFIIFNIKGKAIFQYKKRAGTQLRRMKKIMELGMPMTVQRVLFTLVGIILGRIVARFGSDAIAAQKIGFQIESISFMVVGGLNGAIASFVGQNFGAKKYQRINKGYHSSLAIGIAYSLTAALLFLTFPEALVRFFVKEQETIISASNYLRVIGIAQIFSATEMVSNGTFTGLGLPKIPAVISIVFTILRIPMALILIQYFGLTGVWLSIAVSSIMKGSLAYLIYKFKVWKEYKDAFSI